MDALGNLEVRWVQGFTNGTVTFVDKKTACYTCGNFIVFLNVETKVKKILQSPASGIGVLTAGGHRRSLAFSELKQKPSIFIYNYPELELMCELKGTAELGYTALALDDAGPYLACASSIPDHTITLWNWESATPLCSHPLVGEDVTTLFFNPMNWCQICTVDSKFLTIWNVERCDSYHMIKPSVVDLPATDGLVVKSEGNPSHVPGGKLTYLGPRMPTSAIAGLSGDRADRFVPLKQMKPRLCPSAICWSPSTDLYVGSREGFLLCVNPDTLLISVLYKPSKGIHSDDSKGPGLQPGSFQCLAIHDNRLYAAGIEGILRCIQMKGNKCEVVQTWALEDAVSAICFSPDYETMLLSSGSSRIYRLKPLLKDKVVNVLDILSGDFVAVVPLYTDKNCCVSVRETGDVQLWALDDGHCMGSISLQTNVTSMACCLIAQYIVVGTVSGDVLFVEMTTKQKPRLIHRVHLYHVPVDHLMFDQGGKFLITGASDSHMFVLDARPSKGFEIIGCIEAPGAIVSLSTQYHKEKNQMKVLVLCSSQTDRKLERRINEGNVLLLLTLFVKQLKAGSAACVDARGYLCKDVFDSCLYEVPHALSSCVLTTNKMFAFCHPRKVLQRFNIPESGKKSPNAQEAVQLIPEKEVGGYFLSPALLQLSPHQTWLATAGRDGLLRICEIFTMDRNVQLQCHSCWQGGVGSVCFTPDSQSIITTGLKDGSLVCSRLRLKLSGADKANAAAQYGQLIAESFESTVSSENPILAKMADWDPQTQSPTTFSLKEKMSEAEHEEHYSASPTCSTWLDRKLDMVLQEERQQCADAKKNLRRNIKAVRDTIQAMIEENESLADMEKLEQQEFNLDVEEQQRLQVEGEQEVTRVKSEIEMENLAKCYLREVLKRECWDSMKVKGKAIKAFHSENEVKNYPMKEKTEKELEELHRVQTMRQNEQADSQLQEVIESKSMVSGEKEEKKAEGSAVEITALTGSLSASYGGSNSHLYSQFKLHIREQKINQITLLKDVIYKVKTAFNKEFEAAYKQKEKEISRVREKNKRISEIMAELELSETLWEPTLTDNECPERALTVTDSEIKVEKYLTPEQRQKEEKLKEKEERQRLMAKSDNMRDQALNVMMGGVLVHKTEDVLRMEVHQPEFMSKPEAQWTEEERKSFKEYEKKTKELIEEQEKYRKTLETEMKKLLTSIKEATQTFDERLSKLYEWKVKSEMVIYQEELKIASLVQSIQTEEEICNREKQLSLKLEKARIVKNEVGEELKKHKEVVDMFRETYDNTVAEDKLLDKGFRKEFYDVPGHIVDQLYKLYKRRPRVQRMKTQTDSSLFKEGAQGTPVSEGLSLMIKAMKELDAPENMPEGLDPAVWERFCLARRAKVESEQQVKLKALSLAEMQAFLQKRTDEDEKAQLEIKHLIDEINGLCKEKMRFQLNSMVQVVLQQGQVEVEAGDFIADYADALLIHRNVAEDLNSTIRALGEQKINSMVECKDFRKGIIQQEWEHKRMRMQLEDLSNRARDIQTLRVSQEIQDYLNEIDNDNRTSKQLSTLEKTVAVQETTHQKKVEACKKQIKHLERQDAQLQEKNAALDIQIADTEMTVAERQNIYEAAAVGDDQEREAEKHYQDIILRKKLLNMARTQAQEMIMLRAEVEKLRMKNFPALAQLHYN